MRGISPTVFLVVVFGPGLLACHAASAKADAPAPVRLLPPDANWIPNPALPAGAQMALLAGKPQESGLYAIRVRFPPNHRVMPHSHPEDRIYTVISGTWQIGLGPRFDPALLESFPAGSVYLLPAGTNHFHWATTGEAIVQITGDGPTATTYLNPTDDPRKQ